MKTLSQALLAATAVLAFGGAASAQDKDCQR